MHSLTEGKGKEEGENCKSEENVGISIIRKIAAYNYIYIIV